MRSISRRAFVTGSVAAGALAALRCGGGDEEPSATPATGTMKTGEERFKTEYVASIDWQSCNGCGVCEAICPELAITLTDDYLPVIDYERCVGCGSCVDACPVEAPRLQKRGAEGYTPYLGHDEVFAALGKTEAVHVH